MKRVGLAIAALMLTGASTQAAPKAYMIAELTVTDAAAFQKYAPQVPAILAPFGGHYLARGGKLVTLEEKVPGDRVVVIEFPSLAQAQAFYASPAYQAIAPLRHAAAHGPAYIVEGVAP
ncbi:DUF1330 domain-containing protein [Sphingomonas sp. LB-2]|uniref:DUF1330 domain-containing protein n=1 Tax=Sphingomonas caeni TaxID=2984949 RepID=UPI00222F7D6A|nr:DUF1330 domain-containing protein [Sphingomonas caeni]MCW3849580.1 DUF1330 domain-containing protein [Sphingomonas caeni]